MEFHFTKSYLNIQQLLRRETRFHILVRRIRVAQMQNVRNEMELEHANAYQSTLAIRMVAVALNASRIVNAQATSRV